MYRNVLHIKGKILQAPTQSLPGQIKKVKKKGA